MLDPSDPFPPCTVVASVNTSVMPVSSGSSCGDRLPLSHHSASSVMSCLIFALFQFAVPLSSHLLEDNRISLYNRRIIWVGKDV